VGEGGGKKVDQPSTDRRLHRRRTLRYQKEKGEGLATEEDSRKRLEVKGSTVKPSGEGLKGVGYEYIQMEGKSC